MHEHEPCVRIDLAQGLERENVIGALQDPLPAAVLVLKMLQEALMKPVRLEMPHVFEPLLEGRYVMGGIETKAAKYVSGDFDTFLGRVGVQWVQAWEFRRQHQKPGVLPRGQFRPSVARAVFVRPDRIGEDRLPAARGQIARVIREQIMQKGSSAARQSQHEYGSIYPLVENRRIPFLLLSEPEQIGQKTQHVPSH